MEIEIVGGLQVTALMAVVAAFVVQAVKQAINPEYHRFLPLPLAMVLVVIGALVALLRGENPVEGGIMGFVAAALAVYGYEFVKGIISPAITTLRGRQNSGG